LLNSQGARWPEAFRRSLGVALKDQEDIAYLEARIGEFLPGEAA